MIYGISTLGASVILLMVAIIVLVITLSKSERDEKQIGRDHIAVWICFVVVIASICFFIMPGVMNLVPVINRVPVAVWHGRSQCRGRSRCRCRQPHRRGLS